MAKNPRRQPQQPAIPGAASSKPGSVVSKRGKKIIATGVAVVALGFWLLTFTDPAGQNWASTVSPATLLLGYTLIGIGIVLPDPSPHP